MDNYTNLDLKKNELQKAALEPLPVAPLSPSVGQFYFDTTLKAIRIWDGVEWLSNADLPIASETVLGAIRVGERLTIDPDDGTLSADLQSDNNLTDALKEAILNIPNSIEEHNQSTLSHPYIQQLITQETTERMTADSSLSEAITTEVTRATSAENYLSTTKEDVSNKTTNISSTSTNTQYPTAKAVYEALQQVVPEGAVDESTTEYRVVRYNSKGLVIGGRKVTNEDIVNIDATKIGDGSITNTEFKYLDGVTSNIQNQIDNLDKDKASKTELKTEVQNATNSLTNITTNLQEQITDLSGISTTLQADPTHYIVAAINIKDGGSGYSVDETFQLGAGNTTTIVIDKVSNTGSILSVSYPSTTFTTDIAIKNQSPSMYSGKGTGAKFDVVTSYAMGDIVTQGTLINVPEFDPLVQYTRLKGYVESAIASLNKLKLKGYISSTDPKANGASVEIGTMWYQSNSTGEPDTNFPWTIKTWDGSSWITETGYVPNFNDIWMNKNVNDPLTATTYYWLDKWEKYGFTFDQSEFVHINDNQSISGIKTFTQTIIGNIETSNKWRNPITLDLEGHLTGSVSIDGSGDVTLNTTINPGTITNNMLVDSTIQSGKIANTAISNASYKYNRTLYANGNTESYQNWINSFASKINWLLDEKNKIFIQTNQPTARNEGDLWIQLAN